MSQPQQQHLFVIGFFRSGTSLLYSFLNLHTQIKLLYEADLLSNTLTAASSSCGLKWWERLNFYNSCIQRHRLKPQPEWEEAQCAREAANLLYRQYAGPGALYIGEKSPSYYNCLYSLNHQFPDAKFIMIWRDPLAVISSIIAAGEQDRFFRSNSLPFRSLIGLEKMQADTLALRANGIPVFDLCCEDLIENPEATLRSICDFLKVSYDPGMLNLEKADYSMFPPGEHQSKARSGQVKRETSPQPDPNSPLAYKTRRYLARWKKRFEDQLTSRRYWPEASDNPPSLFEILLDRCNYLLQSLYAEQFISVVYGLIPVGWLAAYRRMRGPALASGFSHKSGVNAPPTKISIITPSYKQLPWLKLCLASIADQKGVEVEHIVQDAQSGPELEDWVRHHSNAHLYVEADSGVYDAINRGFTRAAGDIVCWLNSDEQYLEGTLAKVANYFETHPEVDVLFGDAILISNTGNLLSYRKAVSPTIGHVQLAHLNVLSCATFIRRSVLERGYKLDTRWRGIADAVWIVDLLKGGIPMAVLNEPLSVFTVMDKSLGKSSLALTETEIWHKSLPRYLHWFRYGYIVNHRLQKLLQGAYWPRSVTARFYILGNAEKRMARSVRLLGFTWPQRH